MKVIVNMKFGSHLYGTNTPESDTDYKGVFQSSYEDIVLKRCKDSMVTCTRQKSVDGVRNTKSDVDVEMKELRSFIKDCQNGQTYALDMLFAPSKFWIEHSEMWLELIKNREKLLSKNVGPYIGYCRQQAGKYGLKGSRLAELKRVIQHLGESHRKTLMRDACQGLKESEFVFFEDLPVNKNSEKREQFLNVLGKKFQLSIFAEQCMFSLEKMYNEYGKRAEMAMKNEGVDWKAVSHAFRCCYQLLELAETRAIQFPLKEASRLKDIKMGHLHYPDLQDELYELMEEAVEKVAKSSLPESPDRDFWEKFIINAYKRIISTQSSLTG